ncbi:response regulator [Pseudomonas sp. SMV7]|uniref:response regulator n=1 Tax=Pseudomonas sp. SMV7 TaxID=3390194 RepID=UPI003F857880
MKFNKEALSLQGLRVVVVEDDCLLRSLMSDIILELGAECFAFSNADDALIDLLTQNGGCSLIIADHGVPGSIKGMEFISMAQQKWPEIPAILVSGFDLKAHVYISGSVYLRKPWTVEEFLSAIALALGSSPSQAGVGSS